VGLDGRWDSADRSARHSHREATEKMTGVTWPQLEKPEEFCTALVEKLSKSHD